MQEENKTAQGLSKEAKWQEMEELAKKQEEKEGIVNETNSWKNIRAQNT